MRTLRLGIIATTLFAVWGCDNNDPGNDAGTDGGAVVLMDGGGDAGGGTDAGQMMTGTCGPMGGACMVNPANPTADCGDGMACLLQGGGGNPWTTACFQAGTSGEGQTCDPTMAGQCREGLQCFGDPGSATCVKQCCAGTDCATGDTCIMIAGAGPNGSVAGTCRTPVTCDPKVATGANGCPTEGQGCYPTDNAGNLGCFTAGTATEGMTCETLDGCVQGHGCVGNPPTCRAFCDPAAETPCPTGFMCGGLTGFDDVGVCVPMT